MTQLVIVESPGKVAKIAQILGDRYRVIASVGHFTDLDSCSISIDFNNHFEPIYVVTRPDVVKKLKAAAKQSKIIYLASDMDREGEAIAQQLHDLLQPTQYSRLLFNSITSTAITAAINNTCQINTCLVNAQKARRVIDRLYGYTISPLLKKNVIGSTAAGRVQSVVLKLITEKQKTIDAFINDASYYTTEATLNNQSYQLYQSANHQVNKWYTIKAVKLFLKDCYLASFVIKECQSTEVLQYPPPPFETCSLQQTASNHLNLSIGEVDRMAEELYKSGYITYIRTDSTDLCAEAKITIKNIIINQFGASYCNVNDQTSMNNKAHEAIRPTDLTKQSLPLKDRMKVKLYELIWQRTIASQMMPAKIDQVNIYVDIQTPSGTNKYYFYRQNRTILFEGYLIVYGLAVDPVFTIIPARTCLIASQIVTTEQFDKPPKYYNERGLIKNMKNLGIGRPSTYANTLFHLINQAYIKKANIEGVPKICHLYTLYPLKNNQITLTTKQLMIGSEHQKLVPTSVGLAVVTFLENYFKPLMDYQFTAKMESTLDKIANNKKVWHTVVAHFYKQLNELVDQLVKTTNVHFYPLVLGSYQNQPIHLHHGKYGFYLSHNNDRFSVEKKLDLKAAIRYLQTHRFRIIIKNVEVDVLVVKGKYNFYFKTSMGNYSIPSTIDSQSLTTQMVQTIINHQIK